MNTGKAGSWEAFSPNPHGYFFVAGNGISIGLTLRRTLLAQQKNQQVHLLGSKSPLGVSGSSLRRTLGLVISASNSRAIYLVEVSHSVIAGSRITIL